MSYHDKVRNAAWRTTVPQCGMPTTYDDDIAEESGWRTFPSTRATLSHFLHLVETLRDDGELRLSRCRHDGHSRSILVVTPVDDHPPAALIKRLEQECALRAELDPQWAARLLELRPHGGRALLVLADPGGKPLDCTTGRPLEIGRFLRLAIQMTATVGQVHRRRLVHKDVKPAHVLVDPADRVRLTGFGLASHLPRECQAPAPPEMIAGTLAYMAPERTGRMNRSIDARSDPYSLGITFYEMLTGTLPFSAADPQECIHCHIARQPLPPGQSAVVPGPLSAIVMEPLAKTPEERYQAASGVEADLQQCLAAWESQGRIEPFPPGQQDAPDPLIIPEKLCGREREIDAQFDEAGFEARLAGDRMPSMICNYWILKLKARFLAGDYVEALAAADKVKALLSAALIQLLDYLCYTALTVAALYENASADQQTGWRELLSTHQGQLREWAANNPATFHDKHALVSAEIARLEGRDRDAMRLYEQAIQSAREHGFVQNEGLANEVAARFYAACGVETIAHAYLRDARHCYLRWGALGKVRQLDEHYPWLHKESAASLPTTTISAPIEQLDVGTVVKASQALSEEIVLGKLIKTLMRIAMEQAGAERGLLILFPGDEPRIEAEATTSGGKVEVALRQVPLTAAELPQSLLHYVIRTRESVILDDAAAPTMFSADAYMQRRPRSVLCLPLVKQAKFVGALYLENNQTPRAFTSGRVAVLELLASQAAISLENAALYGELRRSEAMLAEGQRISRTGTWTCHVPTRKLVWSEEHYRILSFEPKAVEPTFQSFWESIHPDDRALVQRTLDAAFHDGSGFAVEFRISLPDGSGRYLYTVGRPLLSAAGIVEEFIGTTMDITERKQGEQALRKAQADLARVARLTTMGELATSIAHEINQPLSAIVTNAAACLRWLANDRPNLDEARETAERIVTDGLRASDIVQSIRALARKSGTEMKQLDINDAIREILILMRSELYRHDVSIETELSDTLAPILGDRVLLQQVILNLIMNGIEAMETVTHQPRVLRVRSEVDGPGTVRIAVEDEGSGLAQENVARVFDAFFTTKPNGTGMGLSICRSIVDAHGGRLWASPRSPHGAVFQFTVPTAAETVS